MWVLCCPWSREAADTGASGGTHCCSGRRGWTLWVKPTHVEGARYAASRQVDPATSVDEFISRWLAERKLDCDPLLVSLRLVKRGPGGVPTAEQESEALQSPASLLNDPSETPVEAGVADGSWLVAVFAGREGMPAAGVDTLLLLCV